MSFQLFRASIDLIQTASQKTSKDFLEDHHKKTAAPSSTNNEGVDEQTPLVGGYVSFSRRETRSPLWEAVPTRHKAAVWSCRVQILFCAILLLNGILSREDAHLSQILPVYISWVGFIVIAFGVWLTARDLGRARMGIVARVSYFAAAIALWLPFCLAYYRDRKDTNMSDEIIVNVTGLYSLLAFMEICILDFPHRTTSPKSALDETAPPKKKSLSRSAIITLLKPYFWPDETADSATINRIRAILTWVCVILSKVCNLLAPMMIGWASTALAHEDYASTIFYSIMYALIQFLGSTFKEGQSLIYLKVAQAAFVQLSETTFAHLHSLSLDWHLRKKLGEVIRSMDRGIAACDTLMKYLFLWLVPALAECVVVCVIFATYFDYAPLAISVFYFVWLYIVWTILLTLWRKKFRKVS